MLLDSKSLGLESGNTGSSREWIFKEVFHNDRRGKGFGIGDIHEESRSTHSAHKEMKEGHDQRVFAR